MAGMVEFNEKLVEVKENGNISGGGDGGGGGGSSSSGAWSEIAVRTLLDSYTAKFLELQRSNLRQKDWQDVLARLATTCGEGFNYARCRNKLDSLKKKFKNVKGKKIVGRAPVKWKWYEHMEKLMERGPPTGQGIPGGIASGEKLGPSVEEDTDDGDDAASLDDDVGSEGNETIHESVQAPFVASSMFGLRASGFGGSGLHLRPNGIFQNGNSGGSSNPGFSLPKVSDRIIKKQQKGSTQTLNRQLKEVATMVIDALERIERNRLDFEQKRMEMMRELELRRNETNLQIAKLIMESSMPRHFNFQTGFQEQPGSGNPEPPS